MLKKLNFLESFIIIIKDYIMENIRLFKTEELYEQKVQDLQHPTVSYIMENDKIILTQDTPSLFSFYIDDFQTFAMDGWTWDDWSKTEYVNDFIYDCSDWGTLNVNSNQDVYFWSADEFCLGNGLRYITKNDENVKINDKIIPNFSYYTKLINSFE